MTKEGQTPLLDSKPSQKRSALAQRGCLRFTNRLDGIDEGVHHLRKLLRLGLVLDHVRRVFLAQVLALRLQLLGCSIGHLRA